MTALPLLLLLAFLLLGVGMFNWLRERERKRGAAGQSRLATWRLVLAAIFGLVALFAGGCSLIFVPDALQGNQYIDPIAILVVGGIPFALAALLLWLSLRRGNG